MGCPVSQLPFYFEALYRDFDRVADALSQVQWPEVTCIIHQVLDVHVN